MTYYEENKEQFRERYQKNLEKVRQYNRQYNAEHRDERRERSAKHMDAVYEERGQPPRRYYKKSGPGRCTPTAPYHLPDHAVRAGASGSQGGRGGRAHGSPERPHGQRERAVIGNN